MGAPDAAVCVQRDELGAQAGRFGEGAEQGRVPGAARNGCHGSDSAVRLSTKMM